MSTIQSLKLANDMKMHGIEQSLERRLAEFAATPSDPSDLVRLLLEDEKIDRDNRKTSRLVSRARFRRNCQLEDWDHSFDRGISKVQIKELSHLSFYHNREQLLLIGGTGSGKTHLAISLGYRLCQQGISTSFYSTNLLLEEIASQKAAGKYLMFIKSQAKVGTLILDDFGLRTYDHEEAMALMDIFEERYRRGSIIITSQVKPEGWRSLFEDKVTAEAVVDRLRNPAVCLNIKGGSYRLKHSKNGGDKTVKTDNTKH